MAEKKNGIKAFYRQKAKVVRSNKLKEAKEY